jgi:selenocysteine lyase/cysteine desulfurase
MWLNKAMSIGEFVTFIKKNPAFSSYQHIDHARALEYSMLDSQGHVYLDYTGAGLYAESQLREHLRLLKSHIYGNPHSYNPTSMRSTELVEQARAYVLEFFNASPDEYVCVFTQNASGALKIVGEAYPFGAGCRYLLTFDNHNSVNGIREYAHARGASVTYLPIVLPDLHVDEAGLINELLNPNSGCFNLFAFPAQSNFSGVQHSLNWIAAAQDHGWDVLLDAAAFVPTNRLDLGRYHPDFVPISFYKMFGYPTGVGALIARRETLRKLSRSWFAGGTTTVASVRGNKFYPADAPAAFEDGTINYLNIPAVEIGLRHLNHLGYEAIHERVTALTGWLLEKLSGMNHANGLPLLQIYGPLETQSRGGTIALNFFDSQGAIIPKHLLEEEANRRGISIRMGFFCNPGAGEIALEISGDELSSCFSRPSFESRISDLDFQRCIDPKASGAVRVSLGMMSNFNDVQAFLDFAVNLLE